jgi:uncharacterized protein (TIGR03643 family)
MAYIFFLNVSCNILRPLGDSAKKRITSNYLCTGKLRIVAYDMGMKKEIISLDVAAIDRIVQMAWEDRTPFEAIQIQFGVDESGVIALMRKHMKRSSFELWRKRVTGRQTKHKALRSDDVTRFKCEDQRG